MEFVCWLVKIERVIHIIVATTIMTQCYVVVFPSLALLRQFYESHTCSLRPTLRECQVKALDACSQDKPVVNISMCTGAGKSRVISECLPSDGSLEYYATDGTLPGIPRVSASAPGDVILTTYISAPLVYRILSGLDDPVDVHVIHDEAHHITSPIYKESYDTSVGAGLIQKVINFSATLPEEYECDYTYPLLRGIKDGVVRDFNIKAIACLSGDNEQSFVDIVNLSLEWARSQGQSLRLLVYTSEANTDNEVDTEGGTSVRSFIEYLRKAAHENGWWMRGLYSDTMGEREDIIWEFGNTKPVSGISILVSCRTLSEGVDLRNANAMLPWDPSSNAKTNIQRIGRILRKLKSASGEYLPSEQQTPSLVIVPVWLQRESYLELRGDSKAIHEQLYKDIAEGTRGSFAPLLNVTAALKSELTLDDDELFRQIINFPSRPKSGTLTGNVLEVVARSLKKKPADIVREMGECDVLDKDTCEVLREWVAGSKEDKEGLWEDIPEDVHGDVLDALVASQDLTLLVEQEKGGEPEVFGNGSVQKTLERKPDGTYAVSRRKRETPSEKKAKKEVQKRVSMCATDSYRVILGVADGAFEDGQSLVRLTTRIEIDGDNEYRWENNRTDWEIHWINTNTLPSTTSTYIREQRIAEWQSRMITRQRTNNLTPHQFKMLEKTEGWFLDISSLVEWSSLLKAKKNVNIARDISCEERNLMKDIRPVKRMSPSVIDKREINIGSWLFRLRRSKSSESHIKGNCVLFPCVEKYITDDCNIYHWLTIDVPEEDMIIKCSSYIKSAKELQATYNSVTGNIRNILTTNKPCENGDETPIKKFIDNNIKVCDKYPRVKDLFAKEGLLWWFTRTSGLEKILKKTHDIVTLAKTIQCKYSSTYGNTRNILTTDIPKQQIKDEKKIYNFILGRQRARNNKLGKKKKQPIFYQEVEDYIRDTRLLWWFNIRESEEDRQMKIAEDHIRNAFALSKSNPSRNLVKYYRPSTTSSDPRERDIGQWLATQRGIFNRTRNKRVCYPKIKELLEKKGLLWWLIVGYNRKRYDVPSKPEPTTVSPPSHKYHSSEFTDLHNKFKSMNSATYFSYIKEHPEEWEAYHAIADQYDARDDPEHSPHHRVPNFIQGKGYPANTPMVDLGCGRDRLRDDKRVSHLDWTSVDAVPASERVVQADLGSLPIDDNTFRLAVISRALWARKPDYLQQLKEALRVIQQGGILVLCESRRKWIEEEKLECDSDNPRTVMVNHLYNAVTSVGFVVITQSKPDDASVWQFLVCQKPVVGGI